MRRFLMTGLAIVSALSLVQPALADRAPYPHEFNRNMGYCAPFLAQERLPNGDPVRPWINHLVHDLTAGDASFEGHKNVGGLYSARARDEVDQQCLRR
jgi:hypothetical protein